MLFYCCEMIKNSPKITFNKIKAQPQIINSGPHLQKCVQYCKGKARLNMWKGYHKIRKISIPMQKFSEEIWFAKKYTFLYIPGREDSWTPDILPLARTFLLYCAMLKLHRRSAVNIWKKSAPALQSREYTEERRVITPPLVVSHSLAGHGFARFWPYRYPTGRV